MIEARRAAVVVTKAGDIQGILFHTDADHAREFLGHHESDQRGSRGNEEEDREDNSLANADNPPVIQKVQFYFRSIECFICFHKIKKGDQFTQPPV